MAITVQVNGLRELRVKLKRLPLDIRKKVANKAVGSAARLVKAAAQQATPVRTGTLRRSAIVNYRRKDSTDDKTVYIVTYRRGKRFQARVTAKGRKIANRDAFYAPWVEFGHKIVPRKSKGSRAARRLAATGTVPGKHFLRDSFARQVIPAINAMANQLRSFFAAYR